MYFSEKLAENFVENLVKFPTFVKNALNSAETQRII